MGAPAVVTLRDIELYKQKLLALDARLARFAPQQSVPAPDAGAEQWSAPADPSLSHPVAPRQVADTLRAVKYLAQRGVALNDITLRHIQDARTALSLRVVVPAPADSRITVAVDNLRRVVEAELPGYWPRIEACLAVISVLRLTSLDICPTLILVGPSGSGKSSALDTFRGGTNIVPVDRVTPAAFVANTLGKTEEELREIDLLRQIQHAVMVTRDMGPMLRGTVDNLTELFKVLTIILDGHGYSVATASSGRREVAGDQVFSWLGATTPIPQRTWGIQAELGSRLMFFDLGGHTSPTDDDILRQRQGRPFKEKIALVQKQVHSVLNALFLRERPDGTPGAVSAVRSVEWGCDPPEITLWLVRLGRLLAQGRWRRALNNPLDESSPEDPHRSITLLENMARGRAMLYGRQCLDESDDLTLPTHIVFSSMPLGMLLRAVVKYYHRGGLTIADAAREYGCTVPTAEQRMTKLAEHTDIVKWGTYSGPPRRGRPIEKVLVPTHEWEWIGELAKWLL